MERVGLDVLVARERVRVGAVLEQDTSGIDVAVEARETERLEPVVPVRVCIVPVVREELSQVVGSPQRGSFENVQLRMLCEQLGDAVAVVAVEGFEQLRHVR